ncbi:MAG TPA: DEAD/DEAH box helicase [Nitrososphaerales archaeon]|nr:DEAD/DEAH box helicase [Nitrososphaerales archaeon]
MLIKEIPGLPEDFIGALNAQGYESLYPPQEEALLSGVLEGENLVLATPTASGKTLVAIVAAMKAIERGGKVVYLAPLRALASEKYEEFKMIFETLKRPGSEKTKLRVFISTGDYDTSGETLGGGDIIVLTNERFDSVIRHGVSWTDSVSLFVADEVHLVGDSHRGPTLEMILAKILRYFPASQILALSATLSNTDDLASWLNAKLVNTSWRPVKLREGIYDYGKLGFVDGEVKAIPSSNRGAPIDVAADSVKDSGQALIFCETRKRAVSMAEKAAQVVPSYLSFEESANLREVAHKISSAGEETEISRKLAEMVEKGAAFHHAGLDSRHRKIVEDAYKERLIKILTSTPTLAAGVNLPARRVVLSSLMRYNADEGGQAPISVLEFRQMAGRAGRPRYDTTGEIVLLAGNQMNAEEILEHYINSPTEPIRSQLSAEGPLRSHILGLIASRFGLSEEDLFEFFESTLFGAQYRRLTVKSRVKRSLLFLEEEELVTRRTRKFHATDFGKRVAMLYIDPESAIIMRRGIKLASSRSTKRGVETHAKVRHTLGLLHLIVKTPDMTPKFNTRQKDYPEVEEIVQSSEGEFLIPLSSGSVSDYELYQEFDEVLGDFRTVLALNSWINESPEQFILEKYSIEPGDLHRMVDNADWLLYSFGELARLFLRTDLALESEELRQRVRYGIRPELIQLTKLEGIGRVRARALYGAGYTSMEKLSESSIEQLAKVPKIGASVANQIKRQLP